MTTRVAWLALALVAASIGAGCTTGRSARRGGLAPETVAGFPAEIREAYGLFASRCSRCHTLSRPLNAPIYDHTHWENYVGRMRRHPGSGISSDNADRILVFLKYYADRKAAAAGVLRRNEPLGPAEEDS